MIPYTNKLELMKIVKYKITVLLLCFFGTILAQQTPASKQSETITITGVTAHIGNGEVISNCTIIFENGKITSISNSNNSNSLKGTIINAEGKHVYPGIIATNSSMGLVEIEAVRASDDKDEIGDMIPHVRSLIAYNAESKVVESMRPNGVLLGQISPKGGVISGTSSIVQFDAWNWEDAAVKVDDGIHLNWPNAFSRNWRAGTTEVNKKYAEEIDKINLFINESKAYNYGNKTIKNLPFEAMTGLFDGSKKLYVHVNDEKGMIDAINFKVNNSIKEMVIVGGYQANKITDLLIKREIPVLVNHTQSLPSSNDDDYDFPYKLAKLLVDAGVLVGIQNGSNSDFQARNLPFYAGQVVGQGLDKEKALELITSNTAKILGIDANYGTLEVGKSATLFISEGDALDMRTNKLTHAFIDGRMISLETHQTELWKRYSEKYKNN